MLHWRAKEIRKAKLRPVWITLGVVGAIGFVVINLLMGREERMRATLIATLVQGVGTVGLIWLIVRVKDWLQGRPRK